MNMPHVLLAIRRKKTLPEAASHIHTSCTKLSESQPRHVRCAQIMTFLERMRASSGVRRL